MEPNQKIKINITFAILLALYFLMEYILEVQFSEWTEQVGMLATVIKVVILILAWVLINYIRRNRNAGCGCAGTSEIEAESDKNVKENNID